MTFPIDGQCPVCKQFPCTNFKVCWEFLQLENRLVTVEAERDRLKAENERLRKALNKILIYPYPGSFYDSYIKDTAKTALQEVDNG